MKRVVLVLAAVAVITIGGQAQSRPKQPPVKRAVKATGHALKTAGKYVFAGLLRLGLNSKGEPYRQ